jgi:hypothetical protein
MEYVNEGAQTLGVGGDFANIRQALREMAYVGMFGPLGASFTGNNFSADMIEAMEDAFRSVLEEVRLALRAHHEMGEALIARLVQDNELLAAEVEEFFDQYGLHTPKVILDGSVQKVADAS